MEFWVSDLLYELSDALDCVEHDLLGATTYHSKRVAYLCLHMGRRLGMSEEALSDLCACAILHDNALTEYILSERAVHKDRAWEINLRSHCVIGQTNAQCLPFFRSIQDVILYHHENPDGSGPFGKREGEIPLAAALIRVADDADVRFAFGTANDERLRYAQDEVARGAGTLYEPRAAKALLDVLQDPALGDLRNDTLLPGLKAKLPNSSRDCTEVEIRRIAQLLARITDYKSVFTRRHSTELAQKAQRLSEYYGYPPEVCTKIYLAAALHDVGKLCIPTAILEKPGALDPEEFARIKKHVRYSYEILRQIRGFEEIVPWASNHHEKLNGAGYPFGKTAEQLDFVSRMLACLDIYQAVSEERPYHKARTHAETMVLMEQMAAQTLIDADITRVIHTCFGDGELAV